MQRLNWTLPGLLAASLLLGPAEARAQSNPQELTELNRSAMDAYNNLDIETAKSTLENAVKTAERNGVGGSALARAYLNLGVVYVGGFGDNGRGMDFFVKALRLDRGIQLDPIVSTPDIQQVFSLAQRKAGTGGGSPSPTRRPLPAVSDAAAPAEGNLDHVPAIEQLTQTAVPVYVEVPPDLEVSKMRIFYRSLGMREPKSADMEQMGDGWGYLIPCTDVFEPNVEYFVMALDDDDEQVGNAGSPQNPVSVAVVAERSQPAPSLPGQIPPAQCTGGGECPPGMPGCGAGGGLGDTCRTNSDCGQGLMCADNFCAMGDGSEDDDDGPRQGPRFFFDVGISVGLAYVGQGMKADSTPPESLLQSRAGATIEAADGQRTCDLTGDCAGPDGVEDGMMLADGTVSDDGYTQFEFGNPMDDPTGYDAWYNGEAERAARLALNDATANGWDCDANVPGLGATGYFDASTPGTAVRLEDCAVAVSTPGFVPTLAVRGTFGVFVTERLSLAASLRYQFAAGQGTLAGILIGGRLGYQVTQPSATGLFADVFLGGSVGQIQPQPKSQTGIDGPFVLGGLGGVQVGSRLGYRFLPNVGISFIPEAHFLLPTFLFNLDLTLGMHFAF